jgi:predicted RNA binding protein YcfA (HicA-like mRNA interferase family)
MSKLPALKPKKVISVLERLGFVEKRQKGSHKIFKKDDLLVVVPYHNKDLKKGTIRKIFEEAG